MMLKMVAPAEPSNVKWFGVVVVVRINSLHTANFARLSNQRTIGYGSLHRIMRRMNFRWD